ncbi:MULTISPECIES: recombinase family protein [Klebsiella pneumoniae complex]|uniref:recombinase family protein n=1 Tax=Klebsiella pneumoniae complex TaxID=3390273 RepID=UPI001D10F469|nr:recombinase family protein [Klebsiella variicola]EAP6919457.1 recombinase family protein [Salmonella enterica]
MLIGYARVSTDGQTLDQQRAALKAAGCKRVFEEKASGAQRGRRELAKMLDHLQPGNVVTVTRLDRLARSTRDLLGSVAKIVKLEHAWRRLDGRNDDGFQVAPFPG